MRIHSPYRYRGDERGARVSDLDALSTRQENLKITATALAPAWPELA